MLKPLNFDAEDAPKAVLFLGNMAWETRVDTITEKLSGCEGFIEVSIACHEDTGRAKGWALATFHRPEQVTAAIAALNHSIIDGRKVYMRHDVNLIDHTPTFNIYIGNLPFRGFSDADLEALVGRFGPYFHLIQAKSDGNSRGFAIVKFDEEKDALRIIAELDGFLIDGRKIEVRHDRGVETLKGKQKSVYISQLPTDCSEAEIRKVFERVGTIRAVDIHKGSKTGTVWSILHYESADAAISAVEELHNTKFGSSEVVMIVRLDRKVAKK